MTDSGALPDSGVVQRALDILTAAAFVTLVIGVAGSSTYAVALVPAAVFVLLATLGFRWVLRRGPALRYAYTIVQLILGFLVFDLSNVAIGSVLLLVVLVSQSVLLLPLYAVGAVVVLIPLMHLGMGWLGALQEGLGTLAAMVFAAVVTELLVREQRSRAELVEAHQRLQAYAVQAERLATVQERNRVARDIHDGLGHALTVVQMQIKAARAVLPVDTAETDTVLAKAQTQAEQALAEVRRSVSVLREPVPAKPLCDALRDLAGETSAAGVRTDLEVTGTARPLPPETEESLYRAAQEGLTNVRKHARASHAALTLDFSRPDAVRLEVRDDGVGVSSGGTGFGLVGVRERAAHLGGQAAISAVPGGGTLLSVEVPT